MAVVDGKQVYADLMSGKKRLDQLSNSELLAVKTHVTKVPSTQQPSYATKAGQQDLAKKFAEVSTPTPALTPTVEEPPKAWSQSVGEWIGKKAQEYPTVAGAIGATGSALKKGLTSAAGGVDPFAALGLGASASSNLLGYMTDIQKPAEKTAITPFDYAKQFGQGVQEFYKTNPWYSSPGEAITSGIENINEKSRPFLDTTKNIYARAAKKRYGLTDEQAMQSAENWVRDNPNLAGTSANLFSLTDPTLYVGASPAKIAQMIGKRFPNLVKGEAAKLAEIIALGSEKQAPKVAGQLPRPSIDVQPIESPIMGKPYERPISLPETVQSTRPSAVTQPNVFPAQPVNLAGRIPAQPPIVTQPQATAWREQVGQEARNLPLGLPEAKPVTPVKPSGYKVTKTTNAPLQVQKRYQDKMDKLAEVLRKDYPDVPISKLTAYEIDNAWSKIADRNDPKFEDAYDLAYPDKSTRNKLIDRFGSLDTLMQAVRKGKTSPLVQPKPVVEPVGTPLQFKKEVFKVLGKKPTTENVAQKIEGDLGSVRPKKQPKPRTTKPKAKEKPVAPMTPASVTPEQIVADYETRVKKGEFLDPDEMKAYKEAQAKVLQNKVDRDMGVETKEAPKPEEQVAPKSEEPASKADTWSALVQDVKNSSKGYHKGNAADFQTLIENKLKDYVAKNGKVTEANIKEMMDVVKTVTSKKAPRPSKVVPGTRAKVGLGQGKNIPQSSGDVKPVTVEEVLKTIRESLNVVVRTGRIKTKGALGIFKIKPQVSRSVTHGDIDTIAHEVGHNLDQRYNLEKNADAAELLKFVNQYSPNHLSHYPNQADHVPEAIAEYFRALMTNPAYARANAKKFTKLLEDTLSKEDFNGLQKVLGVTTRWTKQGDLQKLRGRRVDTKQAQKRWSSKRERMYTSGIDAYYPLAQFEMEILNPDLRGKTGFERIVKFQKGEGLAKGSDSVYKAAALHRGTPEVTKLFIDKNLKPILDTLTKKKISLEDLLDYAMAKHAMRLKDLGYETGITLDEIKAGLTLGTKDMRDVHKMLIAYNRKLLEIARKGGIISRKTELTLLRKYPDYIPFQRYFNEKDVEFNFSGQGSSKSFVDLFSPIQTMKGSTRTIINPMESMVKNTNAIIDAVSRNKVGQAAARLSKVDNSGFYIERLGKGGSRKAENILTVFEDGKRIQYQVHPELYAVLKNLNGQAGGTVEKILSTFAQVQRNAITMTPKFWAKQLIADELGAFLVSDKHFYIPYVDLLRGLGTIFKDKPLVERWINAGGAHGTMFSQDPRYLQGVIEHLRTDKKGLQKALQYVRITPTVLKDIIQAVPKYTDEARRIAMFKDLVKKGNSDTEAAYLSRDLLDFQRRGADMQFWSRSTPFLNANIQGKERMWRSLLRQSWNPISPANFVAKSALTMTLPAIAIYYYNRKNANEKQKYLLDTAPDWMRATNFLIAVPGTDTVARVPKPYDASWAFANGTEEIIRQIEKDNPQALDEFAKQSLIEGNVPQLVAPLWSTFGVMANYNYHTKAPIVPESMAKRFTPAEQYDAYDSNLAKLLGKAFNYSPKKVQYLMNSYLADYSKVISNAADLVFLNETYKDAPKVPKDSAFKEFFGNQFVVPPGKYQSQNVTDFYDSYEKFQQEYNTAKTRRKTNPNYPITLDAKLFNALKPAYTRITELQTQKNRIEADMKMSVDQKKERIQQTLLEIDRIARIANQRIKEKGGAK